MDDLFIYNVQNVQSQRAATQLTSTNTETTVFCSSAVNLEGGCVYLYYSIVFTNFSIEKSCLQTYSV